jgi:replication initiation and membrane attachment protein DnaB
MTSRLFMSQYVNAVGRKDADEVVQRLGSVGVSIQGFREITRPFRAVETPPETDYQQPAYTKITPQYTFSEDRDINFDYERFLAVTSPLVFPMELRTEENMSLIGRLGTLYGISADEMKKLVKRCCEIDPPAFHGHRLRDLCSKAAKPVEAGKEKDRYALPPASFLQSYMNGRPLPLSDKKILEHLSIDMHFSNEVINIMIEYILKKSDNRLSPKFVDLVAGEWARDGIETREQAIEESHKTFHKDRQGSVRVIDLPDYMKEAPKQDEEVDEDLMKELMEWQEKARKEKKNG